MGFDVGSFINGGAKSIVDRVVSGVTNTGDSIAGGGGYVNLATSILSSGASLQTIESIGSLKVDQLLDKASDFLFGTIKDSLLGKGAGRTNSGSFIDPDAVNLSKGVQSTQFPPDLGDYRIGLQFAKYKRPVPLAPSESQLTDIIYLPLPRELSSSHSIDYENGSTGLFGTILNGMVMNERHKSNPEGEAVTAAAIGGSIAKAALSFAGAEQVSTLAEQSAGAIFNPNLSVAYKGPTLRSYSFTWEFSPNTAAESDQLAAILEKLQAKALAPFTAEQSSAMLSYPETVKVKVFPDSGPSSIGKMMKFKKSMVKDVSIDYNVAGIPSFFKGTSSPTFMKLSMQFQEIEYFVSSDYGGPKAGGFSSDLGEFNKHIEDALQQANLPGGTGSAYATTVSNLGTYASNLAKPESTPQEKSGP